MPSPVSRAVPRDVPPAVAADACAVRTVDAATVARVRAGLPGEADLTEAGDVFGLLADAGRLRLLLSLREAGELCVCDLAAVSGMTESAVSHALRLLRAHRIVAVQRRGRMAYYRLDDTHVRMLLELALSHTRHAGDALPGAGSAR